MSTTRRIIILGSTGSIGTQTLEVIAHLNALCARAEASVRYDVVGLVAHRNAQLLGEQARAWGVRDVALACSHTEGAALGTLPGARVRRGADSAEELVRSVECDIVLAAMVGSAGLPATLAAVDLGRDVALANKETLVAAGELVVARAVASGSRLLPVDSEHSAIWQCLLEESLREDTRGREHERGLEREQRDARGPRGGLPVERVCPPMRCGNAVERIVLTASGGPFRSLSREACYHATPAQALKHPTWTMGAKVTIDSASLTNKAFEVVEAHWLFSLPAEKIGVVIHPQSIVHSFVEYADASVIAQLGAPDMKTPIQLALCYPERPVGASKRLNLLTLGTLEFFEASVERFPALGLAYRVIREGGTSGAILNAASEIAVGAFLEGKIPFGRMPELAEQAMDALGVSPIRDLADVMRADGAARAFTRRAAGLEAAPVGV